MFKSEGLSEKAGRFGKRLVGFINGLFKPADKKIRISVSKVEDSPIPMALLTLDAGIYKDSRPYPFPNRAGLREGLMRLKDAPPHEVKGYSIDVESVDRALATLDELDIPEEETQLFMNDFLKALSFFSEEPPANATPQDLSVRQCDSTTNDEWPHAYIHDHFGQKIRSTQFSGKSTGRFLLSQLGGLGVITPQELKTLAGQVEELNLPDSAPDDEHHTQLNDFSELCRPENVDRLKAMLKPEATTNQGGEFIYFVVEEIGG